MKKADIWLFIGIIAVSCSILFLMKQQQTQGGWADVSCDGTVIWEMPLTIPDAAYYLITFQDAPEAALVETGVEVRIIENGASINWENESWKAALQLSEEAAADYNILLSQNGEVRMLCSSCPDQICVRHREISRTGETIICLPHKIVIEVTAGEDEEWDGVAY